MSIHICNYNHRLFDSVTGKNASLHNTDVITAPIRYTTLEHTLIDVLIAAHASKFHPSGFSSMSDLVQMFSRIGKEKYGWCNNRRDKQSLQKIN